MTVPHCMKQLRPRTSLHSTIRSLARLLPSSKVEADFLGMNEQLCSQSNSFSFPSTSDEGKLCAAKEFAEGGYSPIEEKKMEALIFL